MPCAKSLVPIYDCRTTLALLLYAKICCSAALCQLTGTSSACSSGTGGVCKKDERNVLGIRRSMSKNGWRVYRLGLKGSKYVVWRARSARRSAMANIAQSTRSSSKIARRSQPLRRRDSCAKDVESTSPICMDREWPISSTARRMSSSRVDSDRSSRSASAN